MFTIGHNNPRLGLRPMRTTVPHVRTPTCTFMPMSPAALAMRPCCRTLSSAHTDCLCSPDLAIRPADRMVDVGGVRVQAPPGGHAEVQTIQPSAAGGVEAGGGCRRPVAAAPASEGCRSAVRQHRMLRLDMGEPAAMSGGHARGTHAREKGTRLRGAWAARAARHVACGPRVRMAWARARANVAPERHADCGARARRGRPQTQRRLMRFDRRRHRQRWPRQGATSAGLPLVVCM